MTSTLVAGVRGSTEQEQYKPLTGTTYETDNKGNSLAGIYRILKVKCLFLSFHPQINIS